MIPLRVHNSSYVFVRSARTSDLTIIGGLTIINLLREMTNFTCQGGIYEGVTGNLNVLGEVQVMYEFKQCMEYPGNSKLSV